MGWFHEGSRRHVDHVHLINSSRDHVQRVTWTQHGGDNKIIFRKTEDLRFQIRSARDTSTCPTSVLITTIQTQFPKFNRWIWKQKCNRSCNASMEKTYNRSNRVTKLIQQVKQYVRGWNHSVYNNNNNIYRACLAVARKLPDQLFNLSCSVCHFRVWEVGWSGAMTIAVLWHAWNISSEVTVSYYWRFRSINKD